jgi:hypothetical protein
MPKNLKGMIRILDRKTGVLEREVNVDLRDTPESERDNYLEFLRDQLLRNRDTNQVRLDMSDFWEPEAEAASSLSAQ